MSRARDLADSADNDISGTLTVDDITLSGNITVGGTVDGRDLATDGAKLDGVEAGADVTDVTNVTAAGALMESAVTNLAQVKAFDSSDYATAAQGATADAALPKSGGTMTGSVAFAAGQTFDGRDLSADGSKLDGIESGATGDQSAAEIKTAYESNSNTNAYTDAEKTKLSGIETGATADQTKADIDALNIDADTLDGQHGSYYTGYADTAVANLVDSAPGTLDTLNELAAALGDDPNFSTTVTNNIATKLPLAGGTMTGAITFASGQTFDGRDVSADGAKLDGIESGATADQTASEILTAIKTVDGSGSGLNADQVDGVDASSFLRSDVEATGVGINLNGGTLQQSNDATLYVTASGNYDWGIRIGANSGKTEYGQLIDMPSSFNYAFRVTKNGTEHFNINSTGATIAGNYIWHAGNDGSGSGLNADLLDGYHSAENGGNVNIRTQSNGYLNINNWIQVGSSGIYSSSTNGAHFSPNIATSYGAWNVTGSRNGYTGISFTYPSSQKPALMWDASGNGGIYNEGQGIWSIYWNYGNQCLAVAGSSTSSSYGLYEQGGGIYSTGNITAYSDRRSKENIVTIENALDKVMHMRGVFYNKIDDETKTRQVGVIAQEMQEVCPEAVTYAEDIDHYGVSYGNLVGVLIEAIKELKSEIEELKNGSTN